MKIFSKTSFLILFVLVSCNSNDNKTNKLTNTVEDKNLNIALTKGYFIQENEISISVHQNTIYLLTNANKGFDDNKFLLHYIDSTRNFINKDFYKNQYQIPDSLLFKFKNLNVIKIPMLKGSYESIRIGQFKRDENNKTQNVWTKEIYLKDFKSRKFVYKNQLSDLISYNLLKENFEMSLRHNTFFKTSENLYILYEDDFIYFLAPNIFPTKEKFMLHFINEENTFLNYSFFFEEFQFQEYLEKDILIARIPTPNFNTYYKIRIGQFNSEGNLWVQEFIPMDIKNNPLLRYNGEFNLLH